MDKSRSQWTAEQVERHFRVTALATFALWHRLEDERVIGDPATSS
jgi:hypothetical protein